MSNRTFGKTRDCRGCRYWSEMIAFAQGGPIKALCLGPKDKAPQGEYKAGHESCRDGWASGHLGAIDEPGQDPRVYDEAG